MSILHDSPDARVVLFRFGPGQGIPMHRSASAMTIRVLAGAGVVAQLGAERTIREGHKIAFAPHEAYALRADRDPLTVLATITPNPRVR